MARVATRRLAWGHHLTLLGTKICKAKALAVDSQLVGQPLAVFVGGKAEAKETVDGLVGDGELVVVDAGPLRPVQQLEGFGFLGLTLQQPLLGFQSAWRLVR